MHEDETSVPIPGPATPPGSARPPHPVLPGYFDSLPARGAMVDELFDDTARHYDRITGLLSFGSGGRYRREVLEQAGVKPGMRVLDLACGTGQVAEAAARLVGPRGEVVGVDPSAGMRAVAVEKMETPAGTRRRGRALRGAGGRGGGAASGK